MFLGANAVSLDAKGRIAMPARYRDRLQEAAQGQLVVTLHWADPCLVLFPFPEFERVRAQLEVLPREVDAGSRDQRIGQCIGAIERLGHLINQMLVLLSAEPGGRQADLAEIIDLPDLIRERSPEWIRLAEARGLDLGFELDPARLKGDPLLLGEMIANLVFNALAYTPAPGEVTVRCRRHEHLCVIEVEDNGPGIPPEFRERVFERFFRLPSASRPGSGLGLPIVREIARGCGGTVTLGEPPGGRGTLVRVELAAQG